MTLERYWPGPKKMILPINYFGVPENRWFEDSEFQARVMSGVGQDPALPGAGILRRDRFVRVID